jgi:CRISPR-associated protein (TIGR03985 family)
MDDFIPMARMFPTPLKGVQRFHLHSNYQILNEQAQRIAIYQQQLRKIWENENKVPCKLTYKSSSKVQTYSVIVYPVCLYYYERSFYLCAFEAKENEDRRSWYNYRLDRIQALKCLDWQADKSIIPPALVDLCREVNDLDLVTGIQDDIEAAYGFDFYQNLQSMLLRFDRNFHDRYIKNTWRHNTFKLVEPTEINGLLNTLGLNTSDRSLIDKRIQTHRDDAYYKMNYRVKDNSVIMRLRAWCPNVEVLYPLDLRQQMRDDIQKTWVLYSDDK